MKLVGVDIGGTSITAALVEEGTVTKKFTVDTLSHRTKEEIVNDLFLAIENVISSDTSAIGIGVPGVVDAQKGMIYEIVNIPCWNNFALRDAVKKKFDVPVMLDNDANCYVLAVHRFGIGKNYRHIVGITLGTGLGSGIIINGKLYSGIKSGAGEFGQLPYLDGNFEDYCSGKFFSSSANQTGADLYEKAVNGEREAFDRWNEYGKHVAELLQVVIYSLAPELIVFGGSVSKGYEFFKPSMQKKLDSFYLKEVIRKVRIEPDNNPMNPLLGAAALCYDRVDDAV